MKRDGVATVIATLKREGGERKSESDPTFQPRLPSQTKASAAAAPEAEVAAVVGGGAGVQTPGECRQRCAGVRDEEAEAWVAVEHAAQDEPRYGRGGLERKAERQRQRMARACELLLRDRKAIKF